MRNGWATSASIYNWITGVLSVMTGVAIIIFTAPVAEALRAIGLGGVGAVPIMVGIVYIMLGLLRAAGGWGLWALHNWARILSIVLHVLFGLLLLAQAILLIIMDLPVFSLIPFIFFIPEALLAVGLMLQSTAEAYLNRGAPQSIGMPTSIAPPSMPMQSIPPQGPIPATAGATMGTAARGGQTGGYGQVGGGGVAKTELADAKPQTLAWLVERNGSRAGREHRLKEEVTVGRDPSRCEIVIDEGKVSGEHARIRLENGQFIIYDLASRNHTYVNKQPVQKQALRDGDQIQLGPNVKFAFMIVGKGK
jgi:hypothetical protein